MYPPMQPLKEEVRAKQVLAHLEYRVSTREHHDHGGSHQSARPSVRSLVRQPPPAHPVGSPIHTIPCELDNRTPKLVKLAYRESQPEIQSIPPKRL